MVFQKSSSVKLISLNLILYSCDIFFNKVLFELFFLFSMLTLKASTLLPKFSLLIKYMINIESIPPEKNKQ